MKSVMMKKLFLFTFLLFLFGPVFGKYKISFTVHELKLIINACYTVPTPQPPFGGPLYEPTVVVSTKLKRSPLGDLGVEINVTDNGPGIPKNIIDKIFQPFIMTKPTSQGTGLGLSLSYNIVKAHGGNIKVETKEDEGTTFIISIPDN